jgi:hypothetical protein
MNATKSLWTIWDGRGIVTKIGAEHRSRTLGRQSELARRNFWQPQCPKFHEGTGDFNWTEYPIGHHMTVG